MVGGSKVVMMNFVVARKNVVLVDYLRGSGFPCRAYRGVKILLSARRV